MTPVLVYTDPGRGAWPSSGRGGTLALDGRSAGAYFRAPASGVLMPGQAAVRAARGGQQCHINAWAVHRAVVAVQRYVGVEPDGMWGVATGSKFKSWQTAHGLAPDGVLGPRSARTMFDPVAVRACRAVSTRPELIRMVRGHVGYESRWDPAAVGVSSPSDVGLGQINGPSHPDMTANERLDPDMALPWVARFVYSNLEAMKFNVRDAVAAYNLGKGGAREWITDGRPDVWRPSVGRTVYVKRYIDSVLAAAT